MSKSKSVLNPLVLLKTMRPVKPSHWACKEERVKDMEREGEGRTRGTKEPFVERINHNPLQVARCFILITPYNDSLSPKSMIN